MMNKKNNLKLHELVNLNKKNRKRVGRGTGSGIGKTSTRGHKGQRSRSGHKIGFAFEGGQMPWYRRIPKVRGFRAINHKFYQVVNLEKIEELKLKKVTSSILLEKGLISNLKTPVKILAKGKITFKVDIQVDAISSKALEIIESKDGKFTEVKC